MTDPLALAQTLLIPNGLAPLPIYAGTKRATLKWGRWQAEGLPIEQLPLFFHEPNLTVAAICGAASANLVITDCDTNEQFDAMLLAMNEPDTWIVKSPRGGHLYFRTRVPVRSIKVNPEMQILAQGCYVMAPEALHPSGAHYKFFKRTPHIAELPTLTAIPGVGLEPILVRPTGMPRLAWKLLTGQTVARAYASDSEREMAAVCSMVNAGMSFERIHNAFVRLAPGKQSHFGRWMIERGGPSSARAMLERMYREALKFTAHDSPDRALAKAMRLWLADHPLKGHSGVYDHNALDRVLQIALAAGSLSVAVSTRSLGDDIGVSRFAAGSALKRLQERGLLVLEQEWTGPLANIYRVQPPQSVLQNLTTSQNNLNVRKWIGFGNQIENSFTSHDAFRHGALSKTCAQVWEWLHRAPMTQSELVERTGRSASTISRALDVLQANAMIEAHDLRDWKIVWTAKQNFDLNALARWYETAGKGAAQALKHERERELRRKQMEQE